MPNLLDHRLGQNSSVDRRHQNKIEIKTVSEEVSDIIEQMPSNFGLVVSLITTSLVFLMVFFLYVIEYPDMLVGEISINGIQNSYKVNAKTNGKLILVKNLYREKVVSGDVIGYIENPASLSDVLLIDSLISEINIHDMSDSTISRIFLPEKVDLGELNLAYFSFLNSISQYQTYDLKKPLELQSNQYLNAISSRKKVLKQIDSSLYHMKRQFDLVSKVTARDSLLFREKVISSSDIEKSTISLLSGSQNLTSINRERINNSYQLEDAINNLNQFSFEKMMKERDLKLTLLKDYHQLVQYVVEWKQKYLLVSPVDGEIQVLNFHKTNDYVQNGNEIFSVVPTSTKIFGQVYIPEHGAGKIKLNQDVIVKLNNYPFLEFGYIKGQVHEISAIPSQQNNEGKKVNLYLIVVRLPDSLKTNFGKYLELSLDSKGTAEIITNRRRMLDRVFETIRPKTFN